MCECFHAPLKRSKILHFPLIGFLKTCEMWVESPQNSNSREKRNILIALSVNHSAFIIYYII